MLRIFITRNIELWQQPQTICPTSSVVSKGIKIYQPNRVLIHKPPGLWLVIAHQVVMQPRLFIEVPVLQSERLMRILVNPLILFQTAIAYPSAQGVVAVRSSFFRAVFLKIWALTKLLRLVSIYSLLIIDNRFFSYMYQIFIILHKRFF